MTNFLNIILSTAIPSLLLANLLVIATLMISKAKTNWSFFPKIKSKLVKSIALISFIVWVSLTAFFLLNQENTLFHPFIGTIPALVCIIAATPGLWGCIFLTKKQAESDEIIRNLKMDIATCHNRMTIIEQALDHRRNELEDIKALIDTDRRISQSIKNDLLNCITDIEQIERTKKAHVTRRHRPTNENHDSR